MGGADGPAAMPGVTRDEAPLLALHDPGFYAGDPHPAYRWLRREAPVFWYEPARFWALSRHEDVLHVSRSPRLFCSRRGILVSDARIRPDHGASPASILFMDPPAHNRYRKLVIGAFTPRRVAALEPRVREIARETLDPLPRDQVIDFAEHVAAPLPMLVIAEMLGVEREDREVFRRWSDEIVAFADERRTGAGPDAMRALHAYCAERLAARRRAPRDDLISVLAEARVEGERLADREILDFCLTLLVAGNETTRNLVAGGARALCEFPGERRRLLAEPGLLPNAVEEMLRWVTPIHCFGRTATEATEIRGRRIAAGDYLILLYASANRDEAVFGTEADRFDVARATASAHVAFGFGEHMCLGASLARLEARVLFQELLARFPRFELAGPVVRSRSTLMNATLRLPVRLGPSGP